MTLLSCSKIDSLLTVITSYLNTLNPRHTLLWLFHNAAYGNRAILDYSQIFLGYLPVLCQSVLGRRRLPSSCYGSLLDGATWQICGFYLFLFGFNVLISILLGVGDSVSRIYFVADHHRDSCHHLLTYHQFLIVLIQICVGGKIVVDMTSSHNWSYAQYCWSCGFMLFTIESDGFSVYFLPLRVQTYLLQLWVCHFVYETEGWLEYFSGP